MRDETVAFGSRVSLPSDAFAVVRRFLSDDSDAHIALCLTDCARDEYRPIHYPGSGFIVDVEAFMVGAFPAIHKERWFPTIERAQEFAALCWWAIERCTPTELRQIAAEHDGRMT